MNSIWVYEEPLGPVPKGEYSAELTGIEEFNGEYGPAVRFKFVLTEEGEMKGREVSGMAPNKGFSEDTKLGRWIAAILGYTPNIGQEVRTSDLLHKPCCVKIEHKAADDGRVFSNVVGVKSDVPF